MIREKNGSATTLSFAAKFALIDTGVVFFLFMIANVAFPAITDYRMKADIYNAANQYLQKKEYLTAAEYFRTSGDYKDSKHKLVEAEDGVYNEGKRLLNEGKFKKPISSFMVLKREIQDIQISKIW